MNRALLKLIRMQVKGWIRRQFAGGSARRAVFAVLACFMFLMWMVASVVSALTQPARPPSEVLTLLPLYLTGFALLPIVFGNDDRAIAFSPAEVDFLFPGPFRRRELVIFKMVKVSAGSLLGGLIFANFLYRYAANFGAAIVGATLSLIFINLWATLVALVRDTARERVYLVFRRLAGAVLLFAVAAAFWVTRNSTKLPLEQLKGLADSTAGRIVLAPARVFAHVFAARGLTDFGLWTLASLGMIGAALVLVLVMDRNYMEAALSASQRRQARLAGMTKGLVVRTDKPVRPLSLPGLTALGPARAIVKKQLISAFRTSRAWVVAMIIAVAYGYFMSRMTVHDGNSAGLAGMIPAAIILLMFVPQALRFDFRTDLDHIDFLKALPISARAVAAAELVVPSFMLSALGVLITVAVAVFAGLPVRTALMAVLAAVPLSVWVIGLENLVFLLAPTRLYAQGQASMVISGRRMVMLLARLGLLVVGGALVAGATSAAWSITRSAWAAYLAGWAMVTAVAGLLVLAVAWAFARFDVSADMPV